MAKRMYLPTCFRKPLLALALAGFTLPAAALDLSEAYRLALEQDAAYKAAQAEADARREVLPQARAQLMPNVSMNLSRSRNHTDRDSLTALGRTVSDSYDYFSSNYGITLRQPLFRKYNFALYQQAGYDVESAEANLDKSLQDLLVRLSGTYFEALMAQDQYALVLAQKEAYGIQLAAARRAFEAGHGTRTDIDDAQARYDMTLAQELEAAQNLGYTRRQLQVIVNEPVDVLSQLDPERMQLQGPAPASAEEWIARGEEINPELRAMRANIESALREVEKARAGHMPTVDLIAQRTKSSSENNVSINTAYDTSMVGLQASIPLFAGGYVNSQVRQAQANLKRLEQQYEARRREVSQMIRKEFQSVTEGVLKVHALQQAERSADQAVISNQKGFQAGTRTQVDILNAQQQRMNTRRDLAQARYQYILSRIRLQGLVQSLNQEEMETLNRWLRRS
ncbi:TolC family outer membrane protein [Zoogloea sp.]|uniref:TolC family outer membrane protein n=1 Tax=Zoogloea sp. TaxID=49181 RepID=UPI002631CC09|nr:TolC family outer membrane protein [Zoogloea sp.]MDD3354928.1 TolC family outer membrane protein [Zoogloea sp.]